MSVFAVSKVRVDREGLVTDVLWGVVDIKSNQWVSPEVLAPVSEVVDAIKKGDHVVALFPAIGGHLPERQFVVFANASGVESIALDGPLSPGREIRDIDKIDLR
jgi:hypothetical protein